MNTRPWRTTRPGATSSAVTGIQYLLRAHGRRVAADGSYGPATTAAVTAFQAAKGLATDGTVGPRTWTALVIATRAGSGGDAVRAVQQFGLVTSPGVEPVPVDGAFGPGTAERIREIQRQWGLDIDGAAGPETWSFLSRQSPGPSPWPLVKQGSTQDTNWRVLAAQHLLRARGAGIAADGSFGPASGAAVRAFQATLRTTELGTTLGQLDWPSLVRTARPGDSGEVVRAVQTLLPGGITADGSFGPLTEAAVREFQRMFVRPVDGVVGPLTWHVLTQPLFE